MRGLSSIAIVVSLTGCGGARLPDPGTVASRGEPSEPAPESSQRADPWAEKRRQMVDRQLAGRDVHDPRVLEALRTVPRHRFVPAEVRDQAYQDHPLGIGYAQTISQPYIVGIMSQLAQLGPGCRVLEVGTGSGYQAAVLAEMGCEVWTIEIVEPLANRASALLAELGYDRVHVRYGDGYRGWPEHAPFDAIVITAAPPRIPEPLEQQLAVGGRMVVPVGDAYQELVVVVRTEHGFERAAVFPVRFVPMTGEVRRPPTPERPQR